MRAICFKTILCGENGEQLKHYKISNVIETLYTDMQGIAKDTRASEV